MITKTYRNDANEPVYFGVGECSPFSIVVVEDGETLNIIDDVWTLIKKDGTSLIDMDIYKDIAIKRIKRFKSLRQ